MEEATLDGLAGFNRLLGDLMIVGGPGSNAAAVTRDEVGSFLSTCASYTPAASREKIKQRADYRFSEKYSIRGSGDLKVTMNDGSRMGEAVADRVWLRSGGKFYIMRGPGCWDGGKRQAPQGAHWPDRIWAQYQSLIDQTPEELFRLKKAWEAQALKSRGLAKASWGQIAQHLGIPGVWENLPNYAQNAVGSDGRTYANGRGVAPSGNEEIIYTLQNFMPALAQGGGLNGEGIAQRAAAARVSHFERALERGFLTDVDFLASRYPALIG